MARRRAAAASWSARGFRSEVVQLPFQWNPREEAVRSALAWRMLDLTRAGPVEVDLLIGTRFPSYVARHPHKVVWLFHPFRQAYDLHDAGIDGFPDTAEGRELRQRIIELDTRALRECRRLFTTSENNAARLRRYNGLEAAVLRLPLQQPERWRCEAFEPFVLSVGRLETLKRVDLLVRAAAAGLPAAARVVVVGEGTQREALRGAGRRARRPGPDRLPRTSRTTTRSRTSTRGAGASSTRPGTRTTAWSRSRRSTRGSPSSPPPTRAARSNSSETGRPGLVSAPEPRDVSAALARLIERPDEARALGAAGRASVQGISWDAVIAALTDPGSMVE